MASILDKAEGTSDVLGVTHDTFEVHVRTEGTPDVLGKTDGPYDVHGRAEAYRMYWSGQRAHLVYMSK